MLAILFTPRYRIGYTFRLDYTLYLYANISFLYFVCKQPPQHGLRGISTDIGAKSRFLSYNKEGLKSRGQKINLLLFANSKAMIKADKIWVIDSLIEASATRSNSKNRLSSSRGEFRNSQNDIRENS